MSYDQVWTSLSGLLLVTCLALVGCVRPDERSNALIDAEELRIANRRLLETAMEDAFNPPQASRVYVYPHLAHYLTLRSFHPDSLADLGASLNGWTEPEIGDLTKADPGLSALLSFCKVAAVVVFTEQDMHDLAEGFLLKARQVGMADERIRASESVANAMVAHFKQWIEGDGYRVTRTMDRFTSKKEPRHWIETPPDYTPALEPSWEKMRPLIIDSASQFVVIPAPPYSIEKGSPFREMVEEVLRMSRDLTDEQRNIANYWDDNPSISEHRGHLTTQEHRIAPPGHWLNIVSTVTRAKGSNIYRTTEAYALTCMAMYDVLIACWHEKFRTDLVRPITYIQEHIEPGWRSFIQTPPFPEHPSGHSAVSASAATILDALYGTDHPFTDSTEVIFGMGARSYPSFQDAAWEVSMSRVYGGIHYMHGIREGNRMGREVGSMIITRTLK